MMVAAAAAAFAACSRAAPSELLPSSLSLPFFATALLLHLCLRFRFFLPLLVGKAWGLSPSLLFCWGRSFSRLLCSTPSPLQRLTLNRLLRMRNCLFRLSRFLPRVQLQPVFALAFLLRLLSPPFSFSFALLLASAFLFLATASPWYQLLAPAAILCCKDPMLSIAGVIGFLGLLDILHLLHCGLIVVRLVPSRCTPPNCSEGARRSSCLSCCLCGSPEDCSEGIGRTRAPRPPRSGSVPESRCSGPQKPRSCLTLGASPPSLQGRRDRGLQANLGQGEPWPRSQYPSDCSFPVPFASCPFRGRLGLVVLLRRMLLGQLRCRRPTLSRRSRRQ